MSKKPKVTCPECQQIAKTSKTKYGWRSMCCSMHSWDGKALVSSETHVARNAAHRAFDQLWQSKKLGRDKAYHILAQELGVKEPEAHMSIMSRELAEQVPAAVDRIWKSLEAAE